MCSMTGHGDTMPLPSQKGRTAMSDVYLDRDVHYRDPHASGEGRKLIKDAKCWVDGDYWFFQTRDATGEIIIPKSWVRIIYSGDQI